MPQQPEILSAVTTPFDAEGALDLAAFTTNLARLEPLVDGIFVAGTTGEFPALDADEYEALVGAALDAFGSGRVVVHVGAPSTRQALRLTAMSTALGAVRFAALTPYYLPASTDGIRRHWAAIKDACGGELYGYIYPDVAVTDLLPQDLPGVLDSGIDGIKVSAIASTRVAEYLEHAPTGFKLWSGNDGDLPDTLALGGTGTVSGCSGSCPGPWAAFRDAWAAGDTDRVAAAQSLISGIVPVLGPSIANLKHALDLQGLVGGHCRMAIDPPDRATQAAIRDVIAPV